MKSIASCYTKGAFFYIHGQFKTPEGFWQACEPYDKIPLKESLLACDRLLEALTENAQNPMENRQTGFGPILKLAGCASWRKFVKDAKLILIEAIGSDIDLYPQIFDSKTLSFHDGAISVRVGLRTPQELSNKLEEAILLCV